MMAKVMAKVMTRWPRFLLHDGENEVSDLRDFVMGGEGGVGVSVCAFRCAQNCRTYCPISLTSVVLQASNEVWYEATSR